MMARLQKSKCRIHYFDQARPQSGYHSHCAPCKNHNKKGIILSKAYLTNLKTCFSLFVVGRAVINMHHSRQINLGYEASLSIYE
jgi:hypothetical protein